MKTIWILAVIIFVLAMCTPVVLDGDDSLSPPRTSIAFRVLDNLVGPTYCYTPTMRLIVGVVIVILFFLTYAKTLICLFKKDRDAVFCNLATLVFLVAGLEGYRLWHFLRSFGRVIGPGCGWDAAVYQFVTQSFILLVYAAYMLVPLVIVSVMLLRSKGSRQTPNSIPGAAALLLAIMLIHLNSTVMYTRVRLENSVKDLRWQSDEVNRLRGGVKMLNSKLKQAQEKVEPSQDAGRRL